MANVYADLRQGRKELLIGLLSEMRRLPRTTRGRIALASGAILLGALALVDVACYFALSWVQGQATDDALRAQAGHVAARLELVEGRVTYGGGGLPTETADGQAVDMAVVGLTQVLAATPNQAFASNTLEDLARPALRTGEVGWTQVPTGGETRRVYAAPLPRLLGPDLALVASTSEAAPQGATLRAETVLVIGSLLVFLVGTCIVYLSLGRALRPVERIARLADTLSEHELHRRVEVHTPDDELGELVRTFNRMLTRLEGSFNALRAFTADASHELRSPLALMRTELEVTLARPVSNDEYRRVLDSLLAEVQHMTDVVERLLLLARADAGELHARQESLDVADFLHDAYGRWLTRASQQGVELEISAPESGRMQADLDLARRIIDNLLDNALRASPPGGTIRLSAERDREGWRLEVADQGPGVPESERERIFERFARGDPARTPDAQGGSGLGLPLSAAFARAQGGELRLVRRPDWGAVFEVWLPAGT